MTNRSNSTSRRTFIKAAGAAAFVANVPIILADDKPADKNPIVGDGAYKYECIHGWAKVPEGMRFGNTHMVQEDAQGRIFIHHTGAPDSVFIFDADGKFIKSWGKEWCPGAHGMQMRKEGNDEFLYLATTGQGKIVKADLDGKQVFVLGYPQDAKDAKGNPCYPEGKGFVPTNIAFGPNGDFYVADGYGKSFIHQYDIKGQYIRTWGGRGSKDGEMNCNHGIFTDTRNPAKPALLVADRSNERLQYFSLEGQHLATIKPAGEPNPYRHPCHFDQREDVLVCPGLHGRVSILDKDNKVIAILGDNTDPKTRGNNGATPDKRKPGVFCAPHGATFDRAGNIYVTEWVSDGRVIKLRHLA
ncbi:MAG TPA: hypothetical protein VGQ99_10135 [Tepidisphaeraceae bacterium]|nr:hypothetical protein [Tepidisphaeraceae bacterium]